MAFIFSLIIFFGYVFTPLKTLRHALIIPFGIHKIATGKKITFRNYSKPYLILIFYGLLISLINGNFFVMPFYAIKFFILIAGPILLSILLLDLISIQARQKTVDTIFISALIVQTLRVFVFSDFDFVSLLRNFSLIETTRSDIESSFTYTFGLFAIYYSTQNKYKKTLLAIFFLFLDMKRLTVVSVLLSIIYQLLVKKYPNISIKFIYIYPFLILVILLVFSNGLLNPLIYEYIGVSPNLLTTGRYNMFTIILELENSVINLLGNGIGYSSYVVTEIMTYTHLTLLHSDILFLYYDFGLIVFSVFFILLIKYFKNVSIYSVPFIFYSITNYAFENTFIYFDLIVILILMVYSLRTKYGK